MTRFNSKFMSGLLSVCSTNPTAALGIKAVGHYIGIGVAELNSCGQDVKMSVGIDHQEAKAIQGGGGCMEREALDPPRCAVTTATNEDLSKTVYHE